MKTLKNKKILITCGPTWIPIDDVRIISNISTGTLGQLIAEEAQKAGADVTLLEGPVAKPLSSKKIRIVKFVFYNDLYQSLKKELRKKYDVVIHAAAVSDYHLKEPFKQKVSSSLDKLRLSLRPTRKIIDRIKKWNKNVQLVGFKLDPKITKLNAKRHARDLITNTQCDFVVANNLVHRKYQSFIVDANGNVLIERKTRPATAKALVKILSI